ncbi:MAG: hypothetical protein MK101_00130, partial [Phycisphaerales bacterium]|nr:hypothetical protein [Phycisphaerales bacterium]
LLGWLGRVAPTLEPGLEDLPQIAAVLRPGPWMHREEADVALESPASFPPIERDISAIVPEDVSWTALSDALVSLDLPMLEDIGFVTVWRGKGVPDGHKSVTLRLRFRAHDRTLTRDEVDAPVAGAIEALQRSLGAEVRS